MGLRAHSLSDVEFCWQAASLKGQIIAAMAQLAQHLGIRHIWELLPPSLKASMCTGQSR